MQKHIEIDVIITHNIQLMIVYYNGQEEDFNIINDRTN